MYLSKNIALQSNKPVDYFIYYDFTDLSDKSIGGRDLTGVGNYSFTTRYGKPALFSTGGYLYRATNINELGSSFTISFYAESISGVYGKPYYSFGNNATDNNPAMLGRVGNTGSDTYINTIGYLSGTTSELLPNRFCHHAIVITPTSYKYYINGSITTSSSITFPSLSRSYFYILTGYGGVLQTYIADFRIYKRALSDTEVQLLSID